MLQVYPVSLINAVRSLRDHFVSLHVIDDGWGKRTDLFDFIQQNMGRMAKNIVLPPYIMYCTLSSNGILDEITDIMVPMQYKRRSISYVTRVI